MRSAYTSPNPKENILELWLSRLETVRIRNGATTRLRVTDVTLAPAAEAVLKASGVKPAAIRNQLANLLEAAVAEGCNVPLVPNSVGEAIGGKIALRFTDGHDLQLSLPPADFAISFVVRDFVSTQVERPAVFQDVYRQGDDRGQAAGQRTRAGGREHLRHADRHSPQEGRHRLAAWDQYAKTLNGLVDAVGKNFRNPDSAWLHEHASRDLEARPGFLRGHDDFGAPMTTLARTCLGILLAIAATSADAARVEVKGIGTYQYEGRLLASSKPTDQEKAKAIAAAKLAAWNNFVAGLIRLGNRRSPRDRPSSCRTSIASSSTT